MRFILYAIHLNGKINMRQVVRYTAYPVIAGGTLLLMLTLAAKGIHFLQFSSILLLAAISLVAIMERINPYEQKWNQDHANDTKVDAVHLVVGYILTQTSVGIGFGLQALLGHTWGIWPQTWPLWLQVLLAGVVLDLGLYLMHRASHASSALWRLHAIHHSAERLYWLNGGRRHPVSALVLAGPSLILLMLLGVNPLALGIWMSFMTIHLAFQHANLDYTLGVFSKWLGIAEMHRWHHKREFEDAQVNFGEVFLLWDHLFGTFHHAKTGPRSGEVGLRHETINNSYWQQLKWPFSRIR
ncbi:sterol desaturase family protein [Variovorax sp. PCZ-1]|uniref:sterol desaturase family protein n=1 Tax=Variovorax sp. PCZ-1 TaxID=2835533 RepID=UPI001BD07298|nr:sterol desaturase family protein [Variovorax sp. PCZ-1]